MLTRHKKQITYGLGFLIAIVFIVWGVSALFGPPSAPPVASPTPTAQFVPIQAESASAIQTASTSSFGQNVDVAVPLRNPNPRAGVAEYPVKMILRGARGQVLETVTATTYLLPGAVTYAVKFGVPLIEPVASVDIELPENPAFTTIPASVALPSLPVSVREATTKNIGNNAIEEVKGIVTNASSLDWQFVEVTGVAIGDSGQVVGVGQTFVGELKVGEQREFTLQWPAAGVAGSRVTVLATTNIYRQENIVRAIGDPGLLR